MEWQETWGSPLAEYLRHFDDLIGDARTRVTLGEIIRGIIGAGSLVCQRIASFSVTLSRVKDGAQRVIRFATGESTRRSEVDAEHLTAFLRQRGVDHLGEVDTDELWLILDGSDLRKRHAREMESLMKVRDLDGDLVPGYRTLNMVGITPGRRGILYHRLFSTQEGGFLSESLEVQQALQTVSRALAPLKERMAASWIVDRGLDDVAVWRTIWEQKEHVVCRVQHTERIVEVVNDRGAWQLADIEQAQDGLRFMASAETVLKVRRGRQKQAKQQSVRAEIRTCPLRLTYESNVRRAGPEETRQQELWLVEVRLDKAHMQPWLLITDWPVINAEMAVRIFQMYRQRWAVEDAFKFTKECLGWEDIQLLKLEGIRTMVALSWVAAGFLYEMGVTLDWPEVQLLARLGGWAMRKGSKPGKIVLTRGLQRLLDSIASQAFLDAYIAEHGALPPRIAAFLGLPATSDL
jgi:hypothetical protein